MEASARAREGAPRTHDVVTGLCRLSRSKKRSAFPIGMAGTGPAMTGEGITGEGMTKAGAGQA
jgi:hypothetical protein